MTSIDDMATEIMKGLTEYADLADTKMKSAVRKTATSVKKEISGTQLGISLGELDMLTIGLVNDMFCEWERDEFQGGVRWQGRRNLTHFRQHDFAAKSATDDRQFLRQQC